MTSFDETRHGPPIPIGPELERIVDVVFGCHGSLMLVGETGCGKSEFVRAQGERLGCPVVVLDLALFESPGELLGLPRIDGDSTRYALPDFLPRGGDGILLLEEFNRAPAYLVAATYELLTSRRIGEYALPPGFMIVACVNPPGPDYHVGQLDKAMRERFLRVETCVDREAWATWAEGHGIHPAFVGIARDDGPLFAAASPRTWAHASAYVVEAQRQDLSGAALESMLASLFSSREVGHAVLRHLGQEPSEQPLRALDVLSRFARDEDLAARVRGLAASGRTDVLAKLAWEVEEVLRRDDLATLAGMGSFDLESFERFLEVVPGDRRADLRRTLERNEASGGLLDVDTGLVLSRYAGSPVFREVTGWKQRGLTHRLGALAHAVAGHLDRVHAAGRLERPSHRRQVERSLHRLVRHLGPDHAAPLVRGMERLGLEPDGIATEGGS